MTDKAVKSIKIDLSDEQIAETDNYLKGYALNRKLLKLDRYEKLFFERHPWELERELEDESKRDNSLARAEMFNIRHFIMELRNSDEKILLYYHYVRGESVDRCAELLGISRSSGFRLKKRALALATIKRLGLYR